MTTDYNQQALDFCTKTGTTIEITFLKHGKHFIKDEETRDIYTVTMKRGSRQFTFNFGQSIAKSGFYYTKGRKKVDIDRKHLDKKGFALTNIIKQMDWDFLNNGKSDIVHYPEAPREYDILATLQKYDPDTFENFCSEFGYDTDSKTAEKVYLAVKDEYLNVSRLYNDDELTELQEIN